MFFVQHQCFWFQKTKFRNTNFCSKGELQQNGFFMNLCFGKCEKLSFFIAHFFFFAKFWLMFKKHYKNRYFSTFLKTKKQKMHFEVLLWPSRCYHLGQVDCNLKMANLAQIRTPQICARNFFKKVLKPLFL